MTYLRMADAAFAANIPPGYQIAAGYYGGPEEFHQWDRADWDLFPGARLPIWVGGLLSGDDGTTEGIQAVAALQRLGVPAGAFTVLDRETTSRPVSFVDNFGAQLQGAGYRVWVYGSASTVFGNPPLNGYWVADYTSDVNLIDRLLQEAHVRAVQYANPGPYDASLVKQWTEGAMWSGT